jgi:cytoplasmic iron level regulating protein YaaA (DUF328/UPF0246 family)
MLLVISPAKTLDYETPLPTEKFTQPDFLDDSQLLIDELKKLAPSEIASLMGLSDKLSALNVARYESWSPIFNPSNARQALFAFKGDVYTGLDAYDLTAADITFAQRHLRMLSGLYGLLRPLDLMQPYRLEMGTRLSNVHGKDLYAFWGERITQRINAALKEQGDDILLNLASNEYFSAVRPKALEGRIIDVEFRDRKNDEYKIVSFYAKKARGLIARHVIKHRITDPDALMDFDAHGYRYSAQRSKPDKLVFLRDTPKD